MKIGINKTCYNDGIVRNLFLIFASASAGMAVILGAFAAHSLRALLEPQQLDIFKTAVLYQMHHSLALFLLALLVLFLNSLSPTQIDISRKKLLLRLSTFAAYCFVVGILVFSGSLYLLATKSILGIEAYSNILGPLTPLGGVSLILGWLILLRTAFLLSIKTFE